MPVTLGLLTLYYLCDQAAATRGLRADEVTRCMATYEEVKHSFIEEPPAPRGSPTRAAQNRRGYRAFKTWEAANPGLVALLRRKARAQLHSK